jgi:hypothetical protein
LVGFWWVLWVCELPPARSGSSFSLTFRKTSKTGFSSQLDAEAKKKTQANASYFLLPLGYAKNKRLFMEMTVRVP